MPWAFVAATEPEQMQSAGRAGGGDGTYLGEPLTISERQCSRSMIDVIASHRVLLADH